MDDQGKHGNATADELRTLVEASAVAIIRLDTEGRVTLWNPEAERIFGWKAQEVLGEWPPHIPEEARADFSGQLDRVLSGERLVCINERRTRRDGSPVDVLVCMAPLGNSSERVVGVVVTVVEVTGQRRAEEELRASEERFRLLVESAPAGILLVGADGLITSVNPEAEKIFGYLEGELVGRPVEVVVPQEAHERHVSLRAEFLARARRRPFGLGPDLLARRKDGTLIPVEIGLSHIQAEGGPVVAAFVADLSERKRVEQALRDAEAQYRSLVERLPAVVYLAVFGEAAPWLYVSPRIESMLGFTPQEWQMDEGIWLKQVHPDDKTRVMEAENDSRETGGPFACEYRILTRDGRVVWVRDEAEVVPGEDGSPALLRGLMYDVTERKRSEEALRASEERAHQLFARLVKAQEEERTRIAADIHDDSIQAITAVGLRLHSARASLARLDEADSLDKLEDTVASAISRLRHLLFELRPRALDQEGLAAALRLYLDQIATSAGFDYRIENRLEQEPAPEIRTVLFRIAQEALANVRKHSHARQVGIRLEPRDGGYFVTINDDGRGFIADEADEAIPGHLGLSSMRERAELAGGWLKVDSTPGAGATVEFWVPAAT